jgi:hypothetical protein
MIARRVPASSIDSKDVLSKLKSSLDIEEDAQGKFFLSQ